MRGAIKCVFFRPDCAVVGDVDNANKMHRCGFLAFLLKQIAFPFVGFAL